MNYIASSSTDSTIKIWTQNGECLKTLYDQASSPIVCLAKLENLRIASGSMNGRVVIWNLNNFECTQMLEGHLKCVNCLLSLSNQVLASASDEIKLWNTVTGDCIRTLTGHEKSIYSLISSCNHGLISGSSDYNIKIFQGVNNENSVLTLNGHTGTVNYLLIVKDHGYEQLISCSADYSVKIWDLDTKKCLKTLEKHTGVIKCLILLPCDELLSASYDNTVKVWDLQKYKCLKTFADTQGIQCMKTLHSDELLIGTRDSFIKVLNINNGKCKTLFHGHKDTVTSILNLKRIN